MIDHGHREPCDGSGPLILHALGAGANRAAPGPPAAGAHLLRDEALRAITLSPAEILGVADRLGSLEAGRDATLIVTDGDPLETTTHVERVFIQGRAVDLGDRQKVLYGKYRERYRRLNDRR